MYKDQKQHLPEFNNSKVPIVVIDPKLAELDKVVLFPEKVEKARATIAKIGLPTRAKRD